MAAQRELPHCRWALVRDRAGAGSAEPCRAVAGAATFAARPASGVTATPSEPCDGAVTVAGDNGVIFPVTGLIANCDRAPAPSLVT